MRLKTFRLRGRRPRDTVLAELTRGLTRMQRAVVFQASTGKTMEEIASALGIAEATAKVHRANAKRRLGDELYRKALYRNG